MLLRVRRLLYGVCICVCIDWNMVCITVCEQTVEYGVCNCVCADWNMVCITVCAQTGV